MILCAVALTAILGGVRPAGHRLDTPGLKRVARQVGKNRLTLVMLTHCSKQRKAEKQKEVKKMNPYPPTLQK